MSKGISFWIGVAVLLTIVIGCQPKDALKSSIDRELNTGIRNDSLFLGVSFGMTMQEFFDQCWKINREGIVKEGPANMSVQYIFDDSLGRPIAFDFYADKAGDVIQKYNTTFYYYGWAPWNKDLQSDDMLEMLNAILMEWYGGNEPFAYLKDGKKHYYKIDGNRMIDTFIMTEKLVGAEFIDLSKYPQYAGENESK